MREREKNSERERGNERERGRERERERERDLSVEAKLKGLFHGHISLIVLVLCQSYHAQHAPNLRVVGIENICFAQRLLCLVKFLLAVAGDGKSEPGGC